MPRNRRSQTPIGLHPNPTTSRARPLVTRAVILSMYTYAPFRPRARSASPINSSFLKSTRVPTPLTQERPIAPRGAVERSCAAASTAPVSRRPHIVTHARANHERGTAHSFYFFFRVVASSRRTASRAARRGRPGSSARDEDRPQSRVRCRAGGRRGMSRDARARARCRRG